MTQREYGFGWLLFGAGTLLGRFHASTPAWAVVVAGVGAMIWGFWRILRHDA